MRSKSKTITFWILIGLTVVLVFIFPYLLISILPTLGLEVYLGRIIGLFFFSFIPISIILMNIFQPLDEVITPYAKEMGYFQTPLSRLVFGIIYRGIFSFIFVSFVWFFTFPAFNGICHLAIGEKLTEIRGVIRYESHSSFFGIIMDTLFLEDESNDEYYYFYPSHDGGLNPGDRVILYALPNTHIIVDSKE